MLRHSKFIVGFFGVAAIAVAENPSFPNTQSLGERQYQYGRTMQPEGAEKALAGQPFLPNNEKSPRLVGVCRLSQDIETIAFPCPSVTVVLLDSKGKEIFRNTTQDSKFEFSVQKGPEYYIAVDSKTHQAQTPKLGPYKAGDQVILQIRKK